MLFRDLLRHNRAIQQAHTARVAGLPARHAAKAESPGGPSKAGEPAGRPSKAGELAGQPSKAGEPAGRPRTGQRPGPAAFAADPVVHRLAADEPLQEPVFQLDHRLPGSVGSEPDLDLASVVSRK